MENNVGKEGSVGFMHLLKRVGKKSGGSFRRFGRWKKRWSFSRSSSSSSSSYSNSRLPRWFVNDVLFKIVSVFEGVVLVSTLCIFFLCCGCHF
ncbi:hypothetical protein DCAR_0104184 [Daucus carota subsp. sativus]|uniref:Transmembrane protein n=1 Tax=Daucus carota subsp. sativus TaxID=79200 RepID=A0AAF0WBA3_DAUCS|nr:hypothetical protein DCAR_0104184 [Daucus carota subsp. sativus]